MSNSKQHWENVYSSNTDTDVGWFQIKPKTSLELITKYASKKDDLIIDIGGGNSYLSKTLYDLMYTELTVLDISEQAIKRNKSRFTIIPQEITWLNSSVLDLNANDEFQLWHDRAVFHFLLNENEIKKYARIAAKNICADGLLIIGTFSLSGPKTCSGLPVTQYSEERFLNVFGKEFQLLECFDNIHITPSGNSQDFVWVVFKKK